MDKSRLKIHLYFPFYLRVFASVVLVICLLALGYNFYQSRGKPKFVMEGLPTNLSKDVVAVALNYERLEVENDVKKYLIKASKVTTFTDNHQELENVYLEVYSEADKKDVLSANYAVYLPTDVNNFKIFFFGEVKIQTRDDLSVQAEKISYDKASEIAESEGHTQFFNDLFKGRAEKARVFIAAGYVELFQSVEIDFENSDGHKGYIKSNYVKFERDEKKITFQENVFAELNLPQTAELRSQKLTCFFDEKEITRIEMSNDAEIFQRADKSEVRNLKATAQNIQVDLKSGLRKIRLQNEAKVETSEQGQNPIFSSADLITYDKESQRLILEGSAKIRQFRDQEQVHLDADKIEADFFPDGNLQKAFCIGNADLKQINSDRNIEASANRMNVYYKEDRKIKAAEALGDASVTLIPTDANVNYSKANLSTPGAIKLSFGRDVIERVQTEGRTTIFLKGISDRPDASDRTISADKIITFLQPNGRDLSRAEAIGNVVLQIDPIRKSADNYKTILTSDRLECDFYEGNNLKLCLISKNAKAVQEPFSLGKGKRILLAETFSVEFEKENQSLAKYNASGRARYSEDDKNAMANQIIFTETDGVVRLRGGEPTIWDSKMRAKAIEIDWDTRNDKSFLRQKVSSTYYNQSQSDGTLPFSDSSAPVYITAEMAEFDHRNEIGIYSGNVRAWQEENYIRADRIILFAKERKMNAEGRVQTLLYKVKQKVVNGKEVDQPVSVASDRFSYLDETRVIRYEGNVDIKQGADRINSDSAEIFLNRQNELIKAIVSGNVKISQPNRRGTGEYAEYVAASEVIILRGSPAKVEDAEQGELQGAQMTLYMRENRFIGEGKEKTQSSPGRTRSIYRIKN